MATEWDFDSEDKMPLLTLKECLEAGKKGVSITNEHYHSLEGISGSSLSYLIESNKHYDNRHLFAPTLNCLEFGSLVHTLVLEPEEVFERYVSAPKFDLRTNIGKADFESFNSTNTKTIVSLDDFKIAEKMAINVKAIAGDIIEAGIKERSLFCDYDGLILKCRLDIDIEETGDDYDLKTITLGTKEFNNQTIERHIKKYGYHRAAALRNIVRRQLGKPVGKSYLIFVSTRNGNMVRVIEIDPDWITTAEYEVQDLLVERRFYLARKIDKPFTIIRNSFYE